MFVTRSEPYGRLRPRISDVMRNDREIIGYCFTPQDGNSLLSSISAATWFLYPDDYEERIQCVGEFFHDEV